MPMNPDVLVLRWLGIANHELVIGNNVFLLDAAYDRSPRTSIPLGFDFKQIKRASAIFIGHAHFDHVSDAVTVAAQIGTRVFGGPPTIEYLRGAGLPERQAVLVKGGETEKFSGVTVRMILAQRLSPNPEIPDPPLYAKAGEAYRALAEAVTRQPTPAERDYEAAIVKRGNSDPRIITEGTIAYLFTLDNGFRLLWLDSTGPITEGERALMRSIPDTDVALINYNGHQAPMAQIPHTMALIRLFKPRVYLPTHHEGLSGGPDIATEPLFETIRSEMPQTRTISPLFRTPVCVNTRSKEVFVGR